MPDEDTANGPESPQKGGETRDDAPLGEVPTSVASLDLPVGPNAALEFHRRARLAEDRLAEVLAAYRQVKTDNEDYRDRTTRNLERRYDQRRERLLVKFIDILDNLDRALEAAEQSYAGNPLIEGLILVRTQLLQTLQEEGLERIPAVGLAFDPAVSESVGSQSVDDVEHHHVVVKELLRGYRLNGRIARASRVLIGVYAGAEADSAAETEGGLIGADEVVAAAMPELPAEPIVDPIGEPAPESVLDPTDQPLGEPIVDPPGLDMIEPTLEPIPDEEGLSLEEIIAAAERRDSGPVSAHSREAQAGAALPEAEAVPLDEPVSDEDLLRDAFGVAIPKAGEK